MTGETSGTHDELEDGLSAPTRTLLFAPLGSTDVSSAVVHRLRAVIGLGLLRDGERLPKEADLAVQLGVTTFALREALATLRQQGLVITKAGKYGGSFVTYPGDSDRLEHDELVELSSAELRDVGDWRLMLATRAAELAAQRAGESNLRMLTTYAERVGEATSSLVARRAHGRFHLELASAAQSMRMTRAEFAVHEQIDWLFGLALQSQDERRTAAKALRDIANAVRARSPRRARAAAERHVSGLIARLAQLRLEEIALHHEEPGAPGRTGLGQEIEALAERLVAELAGFAAEVAPALAAGEAAQVLRSRVALAGLQRFEALPPFATGVGVIAEVGVVPDHPYWIQWWKRTDSGPVADNHHVVDPGREDFYDYESMEFVARPRATGKPWAHGPYVDYGGIDNYILTVAVPVSTGADFLGVCCADILVADLESWLAPWLARSPESYLLNGEDRVIMSNSVQHGVGDVMSDHEGFEVREFPVFDWSLLTQPMPGI